MVLPPASSATSRTSAFRPASNPEKDCGKNCIGDRHYSRARPRVGGYHGPAGAHAFGFGQHPFKVDTDIGGQIDLVDDQEIAPQQARPLLARNIVASGDVDHEHPPIDEIERKSRSEIVAAG